ncbi:MAG: branched-chain amino acid ABC transporter ATP-binding protein/permease [Burkholderiales bacterium]|nr:branched-chain amino acid ABC transporter ATP-binding protein/permease [Burkholderiales bacterium]
MRASSWLTLLVAAGLALLPLGLGNEFQLKVLFTAGVYYLAASGLNVLVGYTGQKSLGHAGLFAAGAYTAALLSTLAGWNAWLALLAAGGVAALFGVVISMPALRVKGPSLTMVTIGFGIVVEKVVSEWQQPFGGQQGIYGVAPLSVGGHAFGMRDWVWLVLALGLATHAMLGALLRGKYGRAFLAVQDAEVAAESVGVNVYRTKVLAFVISAVTCGLAGALVAQQNQYINSDFISFNLSVFLLLVVLFGGPSRLGPLFGALILSLLDAWLARWPHVQHFAYGALLLFALYAMPRGVAGALERLWPRTKRVDEPAPREAPPPASVTHLPTPSEPLLEARHLRKAYGGVVPTHDVSLTLQPGHVHALIGPNGAGKTTLLNILSGIVPADAGQVLLAGEDITALKASQVCARGIGRTFQNLKLFGSLTVLDNVRVGLHAHLGVGFWPCLLRLPAAARQERAALAEALRWLDFVGLRERADERATSLPYGHQRRLEIARALATRPRLLLLDEPAAGLNPQETQELIGLVRRIRTLGITVLLIEHHMDLVMAVSDHVIVLDYGQKIAEGDPQTVQQDRRVIAAYLGDDEPAPPQASAHPTPCVA